MHNVKYIGGSLIILLAFWQIVTWLGGWNEALFPSPLGTVRGLGELLASGVLAADIRASAGDCRELL